MYHTTVCTTPFHGILRYISSDPVFIQRYRRVTHFSQVMTFGHPFCLTIYWWILGKCVLDFVWTVLEVNAGTCKV